MVLEQFDRPRQRVVQWEANNVNPEAVDQVPQFVLQPHVQFLPSIS
jgi:hypothetical protein